MTFPAYRGLPHSAPLETVALGATAFGGPVGLLLGRLQPEGGIEVLSVYVMPAWRGQGVATRLFATLEGVARAKGVGRLALVFTRPHAFDEVLGRLLRSAGWREPRPRLLLAESSRERIMQAPWVRRAELPPGYEIFPWAELTAEEGLRLRAVEGTPGWHRRELSPFSSEPYEPETSVGLRRSGDVVGWVITHRVLAGYLRYTTIFVNEACQAHLVALPMLASVMHRHDASSFVRDADRAMFNVELDNKPMVTVLKRRFMRYLTSLKLSYGAEKLLSASSAPVPQ
jgi:GNAT superfamily N-acetyltransferase